MRFDSLKSWCLPTNTGPTSRFIVSRHYECRLSSHHAFTPHFAIDIESTLLPWLSRYEVNLVYPGSGRSRIKGQYSVPSLTRYLVCATYSMALCWSSHTVHTVCLFKVRPIDATVGESVVCWHSVSNKHFIPGPHLVSSWQTGHFVDPIDPISF